MDKRVTVSLHTSAMITLVIALYLIPLRWLFAWLVAAGLHELGHYTALRLCGGRVKSFRLRNIGCLMETTPINDMCKLISIAAGPVTGIGLIFLSRYIPRIAICAFVQSVFNLLPFYPLDGGRIIRILVNKVRKTKIPCKPDNLRVQ